MKIRFTKITNTEGLLNKTFSLDTNGQVIKKSNAFLSKGTAETLEINLLSELYSILEELNQNEAIILGVINEEYISNS